MITDSARNKVFQFYFIVFFLPQKLQTFMILSCLLLSVNAMVLDDFTKLYLISPSPFT